MSLLRYSVTTDVFPVLASADTSSYNQVSVTVLGTNLSNTAAQITSIEITIPFGTSASDLAPSVPATPTPPAGWNVEVSNQSKASISFNFTPQSSPLSVTTSAVAFTFPATEINTQAGSAEITVVENGSTAGQPRLFVSKFPSTWGNVSFSASATIVPYGSGATLSWEGPSSATYQLSFYTPDLGFVTIPNGGPALSPTGSYPGTDDQPLALIQDTTFTLTVTDNSDQNYNAQVQTTVTVELPPPEILKFSAALQLNSDGLGWTITFLWITQYAVSTAISGVGEGLAPESAGYAFAVTPETIQQSYTLTATQGALTTTATVYLQTGQFGTIQVPDELNPGMLGTAIAVNADASLMAVACDAGVLVMQLSSLVSASSVKLLSVNLSGNTYATADLAFISGDTALVALGANSSANPAGSIVIFNTSDWSTAAATTLFDAAGAMAITGDGSWLAAQYKNTLTFGIYALSTSAVGLVGPSVGPSGAGSPRPNAFGATPDGQGLFVCGLASGGLANHSYSFADTPPDPLTLVSSLPAPNLSLNFEDISSFRYYPGSSVILQSSTTSEEGILTTTSVICDASTYAPVSNAVTFKSGSSNGTNANPVGTIGANPLIFFAILTDFKIGVFGPTGFSSTPPASTGS